MLHSKFLFLFVVLLGFSLSFSQTQKDVYNEYESLKGVVFVSSVSDSIKSNQLDSLKVEISNKRAGKRISPNDYETFQINKQIYSLKFQVKDIENEIKQDVREALKKEYPFYDLTLKNQKKIKGCGVLFTTLGFAGMIFNIMDINTTDQNNKKHWTGKNTLMFSCSALLIVSGISITFEY